MAATCDAWSADDIARFVGRPRSQVLKWRAEGLLPDEAGRNPVGRNHELLWSQTVIMSWWRSQHPAGWTRRDIATHTNRTTDTVQYWWREGRLPEPLIEPTDDNVITEPIWNPTIIRSWWRPMAKPADSPNSRLFTAGVAAVTGLAWNTVRRYRSDGLMPAADGYHGKRPWWFLATVRAWDAARNTAYPGRRRRRSEMTPAPDS